MKNFTKYLPVKGKIKKGQIIKDSAGNIRAALRDVSKEEAERHNKSIGLIGLKLFLCSRDKKPMDIVTFESGKRTQIEKWDEDYEQWVFNGKSRVSDEDCFKVIGEVSPDAVWVTEGMEFDKDEWKKEEGFFETTRVLIKCPTCKTFH